MRSGGKENRASLLGIVLTAALCGSLASCLQTAYDTDLLDQVSPIIPVDIKSPSFSAVQGNNKFIVELSGGAFAASPGAGDFDLEGGSWGSPQINRESDTLVTITRITLPAGGLYRLTVKKEALRAPPNRVAVRAVTGGLWTVVSQATVTNIFNTAVIWAMGCGDGKFLAGGDEGRLAWSSDGIVWNAVLPGTGNGKSQFTNTIRAVAYGNGKFVAAGYRSRVGVSSNGRDWEAWDEEKTGGTSILALTYGNGKFVAAGDNGKILWSGNGYNWSHGGTNAFEGRSILGLAYGEVTESGRSVPRFVAVGNDAKINWSNDGVTWTAATVNGLGGNAVNAVAYGGGIFAAATNGGRIAWSADGKNWTRATTGNVFAGAGILSVTYGSGKFVAAGHNGHMGESVDGKNWTAISPSRFTDTEQISALAYGGGVFIAGGNAYTGSAAKIIYGY
ncbi:MAG: hypothetical protein LBQ35_03880 [Spirochaetaceae bacterium]|jgi:hypothetical protein|nr:hypothetical protein [Spirochaetaceae bacterium]